MKTPLAAFQAAKPDELMAKLKRAKVDIKVKWHQTRVSPSVYNNNNDDIDALLNALS
jgi:selenocysteine lyase/cysteine desulfurase